MTEARDIDAWLAEHLFGWTVEGNRRGNWRLIAPGAGAYATGRSVMFKERGHDWHVTSSFVSWSTSYEGMGLVTAALVERGCEISTYAERGICEAEVITAQTSFLEKHASLPMAVALSVRAALQSDQPKATDGGGAFAPGVMPEIEVPHADER